jgi:hypothetical protein
MRKSVSLSADSDKGFSPLTSAAFFYKNCCIKKIFCLRKLYKQFEKPRYLKNNLLSDFPGGGFLFQSINALNGFNRKRMGIIHADGIRNHVILIEELSELIAIGLFGDTIPFQMEIHFLHRIGDPYPKCLDIAFFQRPEPEESFVGVLALLDKLTLSLGERTTEHVATQGTDQFCIYANRAVRNATEGEGVTVA